MVAIFADVPDQGENAAPTAADAQVAVARLLEVSADARGCVISTRAASRSPPAARSSTGARPAARLLAAADAAAGEPVSHAHVGTEDGEAFAVRLDDLALVAATERFTLAGLLLFDIRAVLRELARGPAAAAVAAPQREAA